MSEFRIACDERMVVLRVLAALIWTGRYVPCEGSANCVLKVAIGTNAIIIFVHVN